MTLPFLRRITQKNPKTELSDPFLFLFSEGDENLCLFIFVYILSRSGAVSPFSSLLSEATEQNQLPSRGNLWLPPLWASEPWRFLRALTFTVQLLSTLRTWKLPPRNLKIGTFWVMGTQNWRLPKSRLPFPQLRIHSATSNLLPWQVHL